MFNSLGGNTIGRFTLTTRLGKPRNLRAMGISCHSRFQTVSGAVLGLRSRWRNAAIRGLLSLGSVHSSIRLFQERFRA